MGEPTIETLAAISASIEAGNDRESSCAEHGLSLTSFETAREDLLKSMADAAARDDLQLSRRWSRALAAAQRRATLAARKAKRKPAGDLPGPPPEVHLPVIRATVPERAPVGPTAAPSVGSILPPIAAPSTPPVAGPMPSPVLPPMAFPAPVSATAPPPTVQACALPFAASPAAAAPAMLPGPLAPPPRIDVRAKVSDRRRPAVTMMAMTPPADATALPFHGKVQASPPPKSAPPPMAPAASAELPQAALDQVAQAPAARPARNPLLESTRTDLASQTAAVDPVKLAGSALPFARKASQWSGPDGGAPTQRDPNRRSSSSLPPAGAGGGARTMAIDAADVLWRPRVALPFPAPDASLRSDAPGGGADPTQLTPAVVPGGALPFRSDGPGAGHPAGAPAPVAAPLPPSPSPPRAGQANVAAEQRAASFTLAQYARLCAELRTAPDDAARLRAQYGIDDATWFALHSLWQSRFRADPGLRYRWDMQVDHLVAKRNTGQ